jgi:ferredoxin
MPTVSIKNENKQFEVKEGSIIFDALEDQGHSLPHGCLAGSCGACRVKVTKGAELLQMPSEIEKGTVEAIKVNYQRIHGPDFLKDDTLRLSCRAKVLGDIEIEIIK